MFIWSTFSYLLFLHGQMRNYNYKSISITSFLFKGNLGRTESNEESSSIFHLIDYLKLSCFYYNLDHTFNIYGYVFFSVGVYIIIIIGFSLLICLFQKVRKGNTDTLPLFYACFSYKLFKSFMISNLSIPLNFIYNFDFTKQILKLDPKHDITWFDYLFSIPVLFLLFFPSYIVYLQKLKYHNSQNQPVYLEIVSGKKDKSITLFIQEMLLFFIIFGQKVLNFLNQLILDSNIFNVIMLIYLFVIQVAKIMVIHIYKPFYYKWYNHAFFTLNLIGLVSLVIGFGKTILAQSSDTKNSTLILFEFMHYFIYILALFIAITFIFKRTKYKID
jgi:hypothetical protein